MPCAHMYQNRLDLQVWPSTTCDVPGVEIPTPVKVSLFSLAFSLLVSMSCSNAPTKKHAPPIAVVKLVTFALIIAPTLGRIKDVIAEIPNATEPSRFESTTHQVRLFSLGVVRAEATSP